VENAANHRIQGTPQLQGRTLDPFLGLGAGGKAGRRRDGSAWTVSSSDMPFLKALMPCATSPISSEILPRPNSSSTTPITMIQCQILREPIRKSSAAREPHAAPPRLFQA
jgi:hypothetical protein